LSFLSDNVLEIIHNEVSKISNDPGLWTSATKRFQEFEKTEYAKNTSRLNAMLEFSKILSDFYGKNLILNNVAIRKIVLSDVKKKGESVLVNNVEMKIIDCFINDLFRVEYILENHAGGRIRYEFVD